MNTDYTYKALAEQIILAVIVALVSVSVTGCYTTNNAERVEREALERPAPPTADELRTRVFAYPKDRVFDAIVSSIFEGGGVAETTDRQSGIITTGWNSGGNLIMLLLIGNSRSRHSFLVRPMGTDSSAVIYTLNIEVANGPQWISFNPTRNNYKGITGYWQALEERLASQ